MTVTLADSEVVAGNEFTRSVAVRVYVVDFEMQTWVLPVLFTADTLLSTLSLIVTLVVAPETIQFRVEHWFWPFEGGPIIAGVAVKLRMLGVGTTVTVAYAYANVPGKTSCTPAALIAYRVYCVVAVGLTEIEPMPVFGSVATGVP